MGFFRNACVAATVAVAVAAAPAGAATMKAVITGFIDSNPSGVYDIGNVFGGALTPGAAFTATFIYNTDDGTRGNTVNSQPADILSGSVTDPDGLPISATLTIGATTRDIASNPASPDIRDNGTVFVSPSHNPSGPGTNYDWARYTLNAESYTGDIAESSNFYFDVYAPLLSIPTLLTTEYDFAAGADNVFLNVLPYIYGSISVSSFDTAAGTYPTSAYAQLFGTGIDVECIDGCGPTVIPLPASALLLLGAFGGLGALRLRRRAA